MTRGWLIIREENNTKSRIVKMFTHHTAQDTPDIIRGLPGFWVRARYSFLVQHVKKPISRKTMKDNYILFAYDGGFTYPPAVASAISAARFGMYDVIPSEFATDYASCVDNDADQLILLPDTNQWQYVSHWTKDKKPVILNPMEMAVDELMKMQKENFKKTKR